MGSYSHHLVVLARSGVKYCVLRDVARLERKLHGNADSIAWIRSDVAIIGYFGCVSGDDEAVLPTLNPSFCCRTDGGIW